MEHPLEGGSSDGGGDTSESDRQGALGAPSGAAAGPSASGDGGGDSGSAESKETSGDAGTVEHAGASGGNRMDDAIEAPRAPRVGLDGRQSTVAATPAPGSAEVELVLFVNTGEDGEDAGDGGASDDEGGRDGGGEGSGGAQRSVRAGLRHAGILESGEVLTTTRRSGRARTGGAPGGEEAPEDAPAFELPLSVFQRESRVVVSRAKLRRSPFFRKLFDTEWSDGRGSVSIGLPSIRFIDAFVDAVHCIDLSVEQLQARHEGTPTVTRANMFDLHAAAALLHCSPLMVYVEHSMQAALSHATVLATVRAAVRFQRTRLLRSCLGWLAATGGLPSAGVASEAGSDKPNAEGSGGGNASGSGAGGGGGSRGRRASAQGGARDAKSTGGDALGVASLVAGAAAGVSTGALVSHEDALLVSLDADAPAITVDKESGTLTQGEYSRTQGTEVRLTDVAAVVRRTRERNAHLWDVEVPVISLTPTAGGAGSDGAGAESSDDADGGAGGGAKSTGKDAPHAPGKDPEKRGPGDVPSARLAEGFPDMRRYYVMRVRPGTSAHARREAVARAAAAALTRGRSERGVAPDAEGDRRAASPSAPSTPERHDDADMDATNSPWEISTARGGGRARSASVPVRNGSVIVREGFTRDEVPSTPATERSRSRVGSLDEPGHSKSVDPDVAAKREWYELYDEIDDTLLMTAFTDDDGQLYHLFGGESVVDSSRMSVDWLGSVESNFLGTHFTVLDYGVPPAGPGVCPDIVAAQPELAAAERANVTFDTNVFGRVPNSMVVRVFPDARSGDGSPNKGANESRVKLSSRKPVWNPALDAWTMEFRGRVSLPSKKNCQLLLPGEEDADERVAFLFGKVGRDRFSLDIRAPLGPAQSFAIALTTFAGKLIVA